MNNIKQHLKWLKGYIDSWNYLGESRCEYEYTGHSLMCLNINILNVINSPVLDDVDSNKIFNILKKAKVYDVYGFNYKLILTPLRKHSFPDNDDFLKEYRNKFISGEKWMYLVNEYEK